MEPWTIWLIVAGILVIVEIATQMIWALCLSVGALGALAALGLGLDLKWQVIVMASLSLLTYAAVLPRFRKWQNRRSDRKCRTGMDALTGRRAVVTHQVDPGKQAAPASTATAGRSKPPESTPRSVKAPKSS